MVGRADRDSPGPVHGRPGTRGDGRGTGIRRRVRRPGRRQRRDGARAEGRVLPHVGARRPGLRRTRWHPARAADQPRRPDRHVRGAHRADGAHHRPVDRPDRGAEDRRLHLLRHRRQRLPSLHRRRAGHRPLGARLGPRADQRPGHLDGRQEVRLPYGDVPGRRRGEHVPALVDADAPQTARPHDGVHPARRLRGLPRRTDRGPGRTHAARPLRRPGERPRAGGRAPQGRGRHHGHADHVGEDRPR